MACSCYGCKFKEITLFLSSLFVIILSATHIPFIRLKMLREDIVSHTNKKITRVVMII